MASQTFPLSCVATACLRLNAISSLPAPLSCRLSYRTAMVVGKRCDGEEKRTCNIFSSSPHHYQSARAQTFLSLPSPDSLVAPRLCLRHRNTQQRSLQISGTQKKSIAQVLELAQSGGCNCCLCPTFFHRLYVGAGSTPQRQVSFPRLGELLWINTQRGGVRELDVGWKSKYPKVGRDHVVTGLTDEVRRKRGRCRSPPSPHPWFACSLESLPSSDPRSGSLNSVMHVA